MVQFFSRNFKTHSTARYCSYFLFFAFSISIHSFRNECERVCVSVLVRVQSMESIDFRMKLLFDNADKQIKKKFLALYFPQKQTTHIFAHFDDGFLYAQQISYYNFFVYFMCSMLLMLFVCYVFISVFIMIFLRIFDARVSLLYSNIRNILANKLSIQKLSSIFFSPMLVCSIFLYASNSIINAPIFLDQISYIHTRTLDIFSHFKFFA